MAVNNNFTQSRIPNFPTPPAKSFQFLSMPNDLVANGRNYYTEIKFIDYRAAIYGSGAFSIPVIGDILNFFSTDIGTSVFGVGGIRLPLPARINDVTTLNWAEKSGAEMISGMASQMLSPAAANAISAIKTGAGALTGKAINPLLFMAFNHQNFKEYTFEWNLAPRTRQESDTIRNIVNVFKNSSLPAKQAGGFILDYPLIAIVRMSPNNLNGLARFQPMAVQAVAFNYAANPTPSFFSGTGNPTTISLSVAMKEIKLWYRGATSPI